MVDKRKFHPTVDYKNGTNIPKQSKFEGEYCDLLRQFGREGKTVNQFCAHLGRCEKVFYDWTYKYNAFKEAYDDYKVLAKAFWENLANQRIIQYVDSDGASEKLDTTLYKYVTGNRFGMSHQREIHLEHLVNKDAKEMHRGTLEAMMKGRISQGQATAISQLIKDSIQIEEYTAMVERLAKVEAQLGLNENKPVIGKQAQEPEYETTEQSYGGTTND